jgi:uncharacterized membrane protein YcaP (DUF421 family)
MAVSDRASRLLEGTPTTIIEDGRVLPAAARRLSLRPADLEHAVRVQNGDNIGEIATGQMEPNGQLVLTLKAAEQNASKGDVDAIGRRLEGIEAALRALAATR